MFPTETLIVSVGFLCVTKPEFILYFDKLYSMNMVFKAICVIVQLLLEISASKHGISTHFSEISYGRNNSLFSNNTAGV